MSETIKLEYPVYGAQFYDNHTAIIAGGGGEGNNGIPNKVSVLSIDLSRSEDKIKIVSELEIEGKNDSPTGLALADKTILLGINESSENIKKGQNKHLRKFKFDPEADAEKSQLSFVKSVNIEDSKDTNDYQKLTVISSNGTTAAIVSSKVPSVLRIINPETLELKESIELGESEEIQDVAVNSEGNKIAYITNRKLVLIQDGDKPTLTQERFSKNYILSKVRFTKDDELLLGVNLKNGAGVLLLHSTITKDEDEETDILKTKKARVITNNFKKITALDISLDSNQFIAVAGNDNSIVISDFKDFQNFKTLKKIHSFAITKVAFSPNGEYLLSTSAANSVNVYKIPSNIRFSLAPYITTLIILILSYVAYDLKSRITDEQWEEFQMTMAYLYGEEYVPSSYYEPYFESKSAESAASTESIIPSDTLESVAASSSSSETTYSETAFGYETETIIKEGDIVDIKINTIVKRDEENTEESVVDVPSSEEENKVNLGEPASKLVGSIEEEEHDLEEEAISAYVNEAVESEEAIEASESLEEEAESAEKESQATKDTEEVTEETEVVQNIGQPAKKVVEYVPEDDE